MIGELTGALNKDYDKSHIIKFNVSVTHNHCESGSGIKDKLWVKMNREDQTLMCQLSFTDKCYIKIDTFSIFYLLQNCLLDSVIYDFYLHLCTEIIVLRFILQLLWKLMLSILWLTAFSFFFCFTFKLKKNYDFDHRLINSPSSNLP